MRESIRSGLIALLATGVVSMAGARAQAPAAKTPAPPAAKAAAQPATKTLTPPAAKTPAPPAAKAAAQPATQSAVAPTASAAEAPSAAVLAEVVATVNGEKITKGDLLDFLSRYQIPNVGPEQVYRDAIDTLVNTRLVGQFLNRQKIAVPPEKINEAIAQLERDLKSDGRDLKTALQEGNQTMDDLRREYSERLRWVEYLRIKGTDAELKKFAANHKDLISGTQVKASHIFLRVPPGASKADKDKIRQKLVAIKQDIDAKKMSFAEAANKHSEDPANAEGAGGDIGYFGLNAGIVEEFTNAAFALKPGQISEPVETGHGDHLIQVTDRKEGNPVDFEQQKPFILQMYAAELQKQILMAERKTAQIDVKPMPTDLFPTVPPAIAAPPATQAPTTTPR